VDEKIEKMLIPLLMLLPLLAYLNYFLPPNPSRFILILIFFTPFIFVVFSKKISSSKTLILICLIIIPSIVFVTRNITRLSPFLAGSEVSDTRTLAQMYIENGEPFVAQHEGR
jgi:hypothetical protein